MGSMDANKTKSFSFEDTVAGVEAEYGIDLTAGTDWNEILNVAENKERYQLELLEEIESILKSKPSRKDFKVLLGPVVEDDQDTYHLVIYEAKREIIKSLMRVNFVDEFTLTSEYVDNDCGPSNVVFLKIKVNPSKGNYLDDFKTKLETIIKNKELLFNNGDPKVYFDIETGQGSVDGRSFRLTVDGQEYNLFKALYKNINKKVERLEALRIVGFYKPRENRDPERRTIETYQLNEVVKGLRRKTGLSSNNLVLNRAVILRGIIFAPNHTQSTT